MKTITKVLGLALLLCTVGANADSIKNINGKAALRQDKDRQVSNFTSVAVSGSITAIVKIGNSENVRLEGDADVLAEIVTEVKNGVLIIRPSTKWKNWNKKFDRSKVTAYITTKKLTSVTLSGSGSIDVQSPVTANEFSTTLSGSGSIKVAANVKSLSAVISGSGNINTSGKSNDVDITINGSGNFNGKSMQAETVSAVISGSGSAYIAANKKIDAVTSGSGVVYYTGNPSIEKTVVGSGGVRKN
ncbi:head GIN domain-containing protein [Pedobacter sp.]|uniref:head GIN domain-containing protein n=1 Tax=Pedobacter sp. TaxID=1411316 RepID=UPI003D7F3E72